MGLEGGFSSYVTQTQASRQPVSEPFHSVSKPIVCHKVRRNVASFELLVNIHYRYYKFYGNMLVDLAFFYATRGYALGWRGLFYWLLIALFLVASRDALRKYYERAGR